MRPEGGCNIAIMPMGPENAGLYNSVPSRFEICGRVKAVSTGESLSYTIEALPPPHAVKTYPDEPLRPRGKYAVFFAMASGQCAGQVHVEEHWNGMARTEDIRVGEAFRGKGVGRALMDAAAGWARSHGHPALCLETQGNNAPACRFYAAYGFRLRGVDYGVYDATPDRGEAALYWYLPLQ